MLLYILLSSTFNTRNNVCAGACVYKGVMYHTGDSWDDGCDLRCVCDDEMKGLYTCTYRSVLRETFCWAHLFLFLFFF